MPDYVTPSLPYAVRGHDVASDEIVETAHAPRPTPSDTARTTDAPTKVYRGVFAGEVAKRGAMPMREYVIGDLLRRGEIGNIIASSKVGKSWFVLAAALRVAAGGMWLDRFACEPHSVAIIDNELHAETFENRLVDIAQRMQIDLHSIGDKLSYWPMRGEGVTYAELRNVFDQWQAAEYSPELVVLDASYRFLGDDDDENSNSCVTRIYNTLDKYAARYGCAFLLIHHATKGVQGGKATTDVGAGAGAQSRAADLHAVIREHADGDGLHVMSAACRSSRAPDDLAIRRDESGLWHAVEGVDISRLVGSPEAREAEKARAAADRRETAKVEHVATLRKWCRANPGDHTLSVLETCGIPAPKTNTRPAVQTLIGTGHLIEIEGVGQKLFCVATSGEAKEWADKIRDAARAAIELPKLSPMLLIRGMLLAADEITMIDVFYRDDVEESDDDDDDGEEGSDEVEPLAIYVAGRDEPALVVDYIKTEEQKMRLLSWISAAIRRDVLLSPDIDEVPSE